MNLVRSAEVFATMAHKGQTRWDKSVDYIEHPKKVVSILRGFGITDKRIIAAAWLHDVLEDTGETIYNDFPEEVTQLVRQLTFPKMDNKTYVKACKYLDGEAGLIKIADILANLTDLPPANVGELSAYSVKRLNALHELTRRIKTI